MTKSLNLFSVTEIELTYRNPLKHSERPKIRSSKDAYDLLLNAWDHNKIDLLEEFKIVLLDRSNGCIGIVSVSQGGISTCIVDPKIIFATALKGRASALILSHNHPSGNLSPSEPDLAITEKLTKGGHFLEIAVLDHLIVTSDSYYSLADEGRMPTLRI